VLHSKEVLIATDFSDASRRALAYAIAIAQRYSSALSVVHAIVPEPREPIPLEALPRELNRRRLKVEQEMKNLSEEARMDDLNHHVLLERGRVWDVLGSVIQHDSIDLLVLGTHGRGGPKKLALGSVAEQVLRLAPCPALTIGPHVPPANSGPVEFRRILFATDFGSAAKQSLPLMRCRWLKTIRRSLSSCTWCPRCRSMISAQPPTARPATLLRNLRIGNELRETRA
jgi:nucleotide-binding universal stress UspA family protein